MDRFTEIPNSQVNFNECYYATNSNDINSYNLDSYIYNINTTTTSYTLLNSIGETLDTNEIKNIEGIEKYIKL